MIKFFIHQFTSNSRHGTHSPFVYALADDVIYNKNYQSETKSSEELARFGSKQGRLIQSIVRYLQIDEIFIQSVLPSHVQNAAVIHSIEGFDVDELCKLKNIKALFLFDIHHNASNRAKWQVIKKDDQVHVSIDLYYFAMLVHRPQQRKENFKLKFPFWI